MTLGIQLTGTDGSVWDLRNGTEGVKLSDGGIRSLGMPLFLPQTDANAAADGQTLSDFKVGPRAAILPIRFRTADLAQQGAWWSAVSPYGPLGVYCVLRVTNNATGLWRELRLRFEDDGGIALTQDPETAAMLNMVWPISFTADDPFWTSTEVVSSYSMADSASALFFGELGAPPFNISPETGGVSKLLINTGDVPAWLTYEVEGPATNFQALLDGHYVGATLNVDDGSLLTVQTDPLVQFADLNGESVNWRLDSFDAVPVPPAGAYLLLYISGAGRIRARFTPRYLRGY